MTSSSDNSTTKSDPRIGKIIDRKYKILSRVGDGGMGVVYKAEHELMGRLVAVKVLHRHLVADQNYDTFMQRFQREARTASQINHPNAVTIYDFGISEETAYLVMEFVEGKSLKQVLADEGHLDIERAAAIFAQVCDAVAAAHRLGIVHRDLKPDNIVLSMEDGKEVAQVLDFGIAKVLTEQQDTSVTMTQAGTTLGTPRYMSPEQVLGKTLDARSDVYSLAVVLYEMLTGDIPFKADSAMELMLKHVNESPISMRSFQGIKIHREIEAVVMRGLQKDVKERYQKIGELSNDFLQAVKRAVQQRADAAKAEKGISGSFKTVSSAALASASQVSRVVKVATQYPANLGLAVLGVSVVVLTAVILSGQSDSTQISKSTPTQVAQLEKHDVQVERPAENSSSQSDVSSLDNNAVLQKATDVSVVNQIANSQLQAELANSLETNSNGADTMVLDESAKLPSTVLDDNQELVRNLKAQEQKTAAEIISEINKSVAEPETSDEAMKTLLELEQIAKEAAEKPFTEVTSSEVPSQSATTAADNVVENTDSTANKVIPDDTARARLSDKVSETSPANAVKATETNTPKVTPPAPNQYAAENKAKPVEEKVAVKEKAPAEALSGNKSVAQLIEDLKDEKREVREQAGRLLQQRGTEPVAPLIVAMNSPHVRVRYWATFVLGQLKAKQAVPALIKALNDPVPMVSQTAEGALRKIGTTEAIAAIKQRYPNQRIVEEEKEEDSSWW